MSYFVCDGCGKQHDLFSRGGAGEVARQLNTPLLGEVPLEESLRLLTDTGRAEENLRSDSPSGRAIRQIVGNLAGQISRRAVAAREQGEERP